MKRPASASSCATDVGRAPRRIRTTEGGDARDLPLHATLPTRPQTQEATTSKQATTATTTTRCSPPCSDTSGSIELPVDSPPRNLNPYFRSSPPSLDDDDDDASRRPRHDRRTARSPSSSTGRLSPRLEMHKKMALQARLRDYGLAVQRMQSDISMAHVQAEHHVKLLSHYHEESMRPITVRHGQRSPWVVVAAAAAGIVVPSSSSSSMTVPTDKGIAGSGGTAASHTTHATTPKLR